MRSFMALLHAEFATILRNKATLAFTFAFPVLFVLILGPLMGGIGGSQAARLGLVVTHGASSDVLEDVISSVGAITATDFDTDPALEEALGKQQLDFGLMWNGESLRFLYDPSRAQENYTFQELARGITSAFDLPHQDLNPVLGMVRYT